MGPHDLRRGSWFAVVDDDEPLTVTLDVNGVPVPVERTCVRIAPARRVAWSVVLEREPNPWLGRMYGVCPVCVARERLAGHETALSCPSCGYEFTVDWASPVREPEPLVSAVA